MQSMVQLPFTTPGNCYKVLCEERDSINNTISALGFIDIKCSRDGKANVDVLEQALVANNVKSGQKKKVAKCKQRDDAEFLKSVHYQFKEKPEVCQYVKSMVDGLSGCFTPSTRALGAALFCIGFSDSKTVIAELCSQASSELEAWFRPLGNADSSWRGTTDIDDKYESFCRLLASFRGSHHDLISYVDKLIASDPNKFFCMSTRPVAMRGFGPLDKAHFVAYCEHKLHVKVVLVDENAEDHDWTTRRSSKNAMRTLCMLEKHELLDFVGEHDVIAENKKLFDSSVLRRDVYGVIKEVHVFCASRRICFLFEPNGGHVNSDDEVKSFVFGVKRCRAKVFFRDAQILKVDTFAHLMCRLSRRVSFEKVIMCHRFQEDALFRGMIWTFMQKIHSGMFNRACHLGVQPRNLVFGPSLQSLADVHNLTGLCIVPLAKDAIAPTLSAGDAAFCTNPPLFGHVTQVGPDACDFRVHSNQKVVRVSLSACHSCIKTSKGGFLVPASAMLTIKTILFSNVNLLIPRDIDPCNRNDLIRLGVLLSETVTVIELERYETGQSDGENDTKLTRLAEIIKQTCGA
jgi:hypothetical protein